jgi:hypothetical protein
MYIVRFNKEALRVTICNLYPSLELTSPVYCSNSICHVSPIQQTYSGITSASFGITSNQKAVKGALLYKLRRKCATRTDNHLNNSTASIENTETNLHLLAVWDIEDYKHKPYACLIEFSDDITWDEDKLWVLLHQYNDQFFKDYNYLTNTWLVHGGPGMKTKRNITYESEYRADIIIYEGTWQYNMDKPVKIDPKRLVLPLLMLIVLIYTISLLIPSSFKLNIHNQCLNVGLASPIYVTNDGLECHRAPDHKVYARDTTKSGFIINKSDDGSYGVLIYRLQVRQSHESTEICEDTSSAAQLLVVWRISESKELYADALLTEYTRTFTWNRGKLNKLYHENHDRLKKYANTISDTWLIDNNVTLKTTFSARDLKENLELSISISEERDEYAMRPFCIDLTR